MLPNLCSWHANESLCLYPIFVSTIFTCSFVDLCCLFYLIIESQYLFTFRMYAPRAYTFHFAWPN